MIVAIVLIVNDNDNDILMLIARCSEWPGIIVGIGGLEDLDTNEQLHVAAGP